MKPLESLTIHKFRGIQELDLPYLGQINLFVGANNSGKTSVLEAISTYCRPLDILEWFNTARRREIKSSRRPQLDTLRWIFPQHQYPLNGDLYGGETTIFGQGQFPVRESRAFYQEFEGIIASDDSEIEDSDSQIYLEGDIKTSENLVDLTQRGATIELKVKFEEQFDKIEETSRYSEFWENKEFRLIQSGSKDLRLSVETVTPFSHRVEHLQAELLSKATLEGFKAKIIQLLQKIDSGIEDIEILSPSGMRTTIYLSHQRIGLAPLSVFGDGIRRLLFIALSLAKVREGVLLIDELETAIHAEALKSSFAWLVQSCLEMDVQLFATTHSLEVVDNLLSATPPSTDLVLYRLESQEDDTKAVRLDRERLQRLREDLGMEVRA